MSNSHDRVDVAVIGGGPVGSVLTALLARSGMECVLLDRDPGAPLQSEPDPRALALTPASRRILEHVRAWPLLPRERVGEFRRMEIWDSAGSGSIEFDSADLCLDALGHIVEQPVLQDALNRALSQQGAVEVLRPAQATALDWRANDRVTIDLDDGRRLEARLVVAADGANSPTRELAGIHCPTRDYDQQALACVVSTEYAHGKTARQRFLEGGPLAFLPMADSHSCGIVWSTTPAHARHLLELDPDAFHRILGEAFEHVLGEITGSGARRTFTLRGAHASRYCRERFALIGDAAHVVHPLAGMGANLGLLDAASLAEVLQDARGAGRDIGRMQTLRRYERWRRGENAIMLGLLDGLRRIFAGTTPPLPRVRNAGMDALDVLAPLKRAIMRRASGLSGDVPELVRARF